MKKAIVFNKVIPTLGLGLMGQLVLAGNITDINVSAFPNNQKVVKIKFDKDVVLPKASAVGGATQLAFDFPATSLAVSQPVFEYEDPLLNRIATVANNGAARVLVGLNKESRYAAEVKGNEVWIHIAENGAAPSSVSASQVQRNRQTQNVASAMIDFRKSGKNGGVVDITAPGFSGQPDVKQNSGSITVTLKNYPLPTQAQRNLDVSDFGTPVRNVVLKRIGNDTQVVIKNQGSWSSNHKVANGRISLDISPKLNADEAGLQSKQKSFKGGRVSFDFQDIEVTTILQIIAKESGMNIVASDSVKGRMTLTLKDVPWDQALDLVMQARGLDMRRSGNIINVAPRSELLAQEKEILVQKKEIDELGPLYSRTFQLRYKNVEEFRKILKLDDASSDSSGNSKTILSTRGSALIDPATNTLIITDNSTVLQKFEKLIDQLDVPARQVMVETRIVEASDGFSRELGVKFGYAGSNGKNSWGSNWANAQANNNTNVNANQNNTNRTWTLNPNVNLPTTAATTSVALVHALSSGALALELSAQQAQNRAKVISSPRVLTQDRKEAVIESGTEVPYQEASSSGATSTSFKKAVLGMTVTPQITPDGQVIMDIKVNKDSVNRNCGASEPCIDTKRLDTRAMVENGGTLILGGIYEEENSEGINKVPLLGDIPVVGNLFKHRSRTNSKKELLIFITPRIVDNVGSTLRY
ncbi:Type IV pilus biogenesis and competence protein pilQ precursor [Kingella potus]|uniref:Type IV pilus biogenesis and competence protein PilQ n=1 Tax=Kingella potus TaxID=265175 RepID=A0A377R3Z0_9NEIS|nr:type IV pilus secretin PilQ family protein [Kingella potus]UOP00259.1 type IV pilus secretin PilQ family protein [Kingella potus]STR02682.1 Type IV pilus biogenesis and competence protein pilQ precursor [Kingella potus]